MDNVWPRQDIQSISIHYEQTEEAIRKLFAPESDFYSVNLLGLTVIEINNLLLKRLTELQMNCCFFLLAEIEANFRVDYQNRVKGRKRDDLSRYFRSLYKTKKLHVQLDEEILEAWKTFHPSLSTIIGEFRGALNLRNWLAHGRYWYPKFGRKYDYIYIRLLSDIILEYFPFA